MLALSASLNICKLLSSETELMGWRAQGLPPDALSYQNALAILHAVQPPLVIDPSSQVTGLQNTAPLPGRTLA
jgi:hypothetical protein